MGSVPCTADSTTDIVRAAQNGDAHAYEQLIERYTNLVWSTVRSFRLRDADAHDAVQNTWLRMIEHLVDLRDAERIAGWLATTASRECLKILRHGRREIAGVEPTVFDRADDRAPSPERHTTDRRMGELLWMHLDQLPPQGRDLLVALTIGDTPHYADLARATGMPIGSIGPTRMRYLRKLRQRLEHAGLGVQAWW
jgi:RNA polymerase sigma factor (sigma-70 family)